ncbi:MAG: acyclic terpene utilization AtuA family protein [Candidatus Nanopelagicales bacterium]
MTAPRVRILAFVNHIAPAPDIETSIQRALEWGVDVIVAQGTGSDWGPYWLGSGEQVASNVAQNMRPYLAAAQERGIPFVFSVGIAGADQHLDQCLRAIDDLCRREGWAFDIGVIRAELSKEYMKARLDDGALIAPATSGAPLVDRLTHHDIDTTERMVALLGPEPIIAALQQEVDGVITGRALDIGLFMALPMLRGIPTAVAAHAGKLLECGGLALEPGDSGQCIWADVTNDGFEVRSPHPGHDVSVRSLVSHTFYERAHPSLEENPGGCLDLTAAAYEPTDAGVRCSGAQWIERPYTVLVEGARREGFRAISVLGVRDPRLLGQIREWARAAEDAVTRSPRFAEHVAAGRLRVSTRIFGLDGVLGALEPHTAVTGHEAAVVLDVVAHDRELAEEAAYFGFIRLFIGPYPGRQTTAGNAAAPYMPVVIPVSDVFTFSVYHLLPLDDPLEPFPVTRARIGAAHRTKEVVGAAS